jgi:dolichol-phosphate mannosyltransferase
MTNFSSLAIVIPSYNESKNLEKLIPWIMRVVPKVTVIVIDDSRDEEAKKISAFIRKLNTTSVCYTHRTAKGGRGSAVLEGLKQALVHKQIKWMMEMDADLGHSPDELCRFWEKRESADLIIGSRYREGSAILDWPLRRRVQSKIINFFLRYWLGLNLTDFTNGYRMYTRDVVSYLMTCHMIETGFISLSEISYFVQKKGFRIAEVPVTFTDRTYGKSSANLRELLTSLRGALRLRFRNP